MSVLAGSRGLLIAGLMLVVAGAGPAGGADPVFSVDPTSGARGTNFQAFASGPGNTCPNPTDVVFVVFYDAVDAEAESDPIPVQPDGSWTATFRVPDRAESGEAEIEAGCYENADTFEPNMLYALNPFTVTD